MEDKVKYTLVKKITDDTFEVDHLHEYVLSIQVGPSVFRFCVIDSIRNRCLQIEDYKFNYPLEPSQILEQLDLIFDDNTLLKAGFWRSIKLSVKNLKFSLIPNSLFSDQYTADFLRLNCDFTENEEVHYFKHGTNDTVNIFVAEKKIINWFKAQYPNKTIEVIHHTSLLIEGVLQNYSSTEKQKVYISIEDSIVTIVVKKGFNLEFCNNFQFRTANDFVYFVMFVFDELDLNPEVIPIILLGDISKNSESFNKIYRYIRNVSFGDKPTTLKFGYKFDEVNDHHYFDLYNMHLC